jgi:hypothetical protein
MTTKTKPAQEIRFGAIKATIWENKTANGSRFNVTISRLFKDGENWERTESFGRDDLLLVAKVADLAHTWVFDQNKQPKENAPE